MRKFMAFAALIGFMLIGAVAPFDTQVAQAGGGEPQDRAWLFNETPNAQHGDPLILRVDFEFARPVMGIELREVSSLGLRSHRQVWRQVDDRPAGSARFEMLLVRTDEPIPTLGIRYSIDDWLLAPNEIFLYVQTNDGRPHFAGRFNIGG